MSTEPILFDHRPCAAANGFMTQLTDARRVTRIAEVMGCQIPQGFMRQNWNRVAVSHQAGNSSTDHSGYNL